MNATGMNIVLAMLVAVLIGAVLPLQGLVNARLGSHVGGPVVAAFVSFLVGSVALGLYLLATRTPVTLQGSLQLPPWIWMGGLPVLGQVTASLLLDRFGVLQAAKAVDGLRILGALLVLAGVVLVVAPWRGAPVANPPAGSEGMPARH